MLINTDCLGLRAKTSEEAYGSKRPEEYRMAIIGDSVTFGEDIPRTEDTYFQALENILYHQQHATAVKYFISVHQLIGVTPMAATLQHRMVEIPPHLVFMVRIPQCERCSQESI